MIGRLNQGVVHWIEDPTPSRLLSAVDRVVPLTGAGISEGAGIPGGRALCAALRALRPSLAPTVEDPRLMVDALVTAGIDQDAITDVIAASLDLAAIPGWAPNDVLRALVKVPSKVVLTLNYDLSLEKAAEVEGIEAKSYGPRELGQMLRDIDDHGSRGPLRVGHLHGMLDEPYSIVAGSLSYGTLGAAAPGFLGRLMRNFCVLLLGTSLNEDVLRVQLRAWAPTSPRHVLITSQESLAALSAPGVALEEASATLGIIPVALPTPGYGDLAPFLDDLTSQERLSTERLKRGPRVRAEAPAPSEFYVPVPLVKRKTGDDATDLAWAVGLGTAEALLEGDVAERSRTVVVGTGGAGKSELLRSLGRLVGHQRHTLLIPAASLIPPFGGDADAVLQDWAQRGQVFGGKSEPVSDEALDRLSFHFLFDGLDELPLERRPSFVRMLVEIGLRYPQHHITVTTRPTDALAEFPEDWDQLEMVPELGWGEQYLERRGLSEAELRRAAPALSDVRELMTVPFFLDGVVRLYQEGALGSLRSHGDLLTALIDSALEASAQRLGRAAPRQWLQQVALAMQLNGRFAITREEASGVGFGAAAERVVNADDVIEALISRSVFVEEGGNIRFAHRLLADQLVAEALCDLGPGPELLDLVCPRKDSGLSAVLVAWLVPLALAMEADADWRAAVADRDPLTAACATPASAPLDERRQAAWLIWETYRDWQIWLHDYEVHPIARPSTALTRLLADPDLSDVAEAIRPSLDDGSPVVRASAIEVLADAGTKDLDAPLSAFLDDDDEDPVVRRWAARAASELGLVELFGVVRDRALAATDQAEAQELSVFAIELAPEDDVLVAAEELAERHPDQQWYIARAVRGRAAGARGGLTLHRRWARTGTGRDLSKRDLALLIDEVEVDEAVLEDIGYLAAAIGGGLEAPFGDLIAKHPDETLRGMLAAVADGAAAEWDLLGMLPAFPAATLRAAGAPDRLVATREGWDSPTPSPLAAPQSHFDSSPAKSRLSDLLERDIGEVEAALIDDATSLARARELPEDQRKKLAGWLSGRWPADGIRSGVTENMRGGYNLSPEAAAWISYGALSGVAIAPDRWAELVLLPFIHFDERARRWFRVNYTDEAGVLLIEEASTLTARQWADLLDAIPNKVPAGLLEILGAAAPEYEDSRDLEWLGKILVKKGHIETLRRLMTCADAIENALLPHLAWAGDLPSQARLLGEMTQAFQAGADFRHPVDWLSAVRHPGLLDELFEALDASYRRPLSPGEINDSMNPIHEAIRRVADESAVERYQLMIEQAEDPVPGAQFLRHSLDRLIQAILEKVAGPVREQLADRFALRLRQPSDEETAPHAA